MWIQQFSVDLKLNSIQRWTIPSKYDVTHAMQYKQSFLYFGTTHPPQQTIQNRPRELPYRREPHTLRGFSATLIDDAFLWFPIPEVSMNGYEFLNDVSTSQHGIEFRMHLDALVLDLMDPSQYWKKGRVEVPSFRWRAIGEPEPLIFNEFQKYQVKVKFDKSNKITITDKQNACCTGQFKPSQSFLDGHLNCVMISNDLYLIIKNQMIVIQKLDQKITENEANLSSDFEITVPHLNSTPFVVQDVLFLVGGCDSHHEPFPDIYQFNHDTISWQMYGRTTVSCYGARVVVFKGNNRKERVFIAGGFKQEGSAIEIIPIDIF